MSKARKLFAAIVDEWRVTAARSSLERGLRVFPFPTCSVVVMCERFGGGGGEEGKQWWRRWRWL